MQAAVTMILGGASDLLGDPLQLLEPGFGMRFDKRNFAIRILALGIKTMESLTLSPISARFLIAVGLTVMAVYPLWVVGYPPRYVGQPPQEWLNPEPQGGNGWGVGRWRYRDTSGPDEKSISTRSR
jgi:hypothetical protein